MVTSSFSAARALDCSSRLRASSRQATCCSMWERISLASCPMIGRSSEESLPICLRMAVSSPFCPENGPAERPAPCGLPPWPGLRLRPSVWPPVRFHRYSVPPRRPGCGKSMCCVFIPSPGASGSVGRKGGVLAGRFARLSAAPPAKVGRNGEEEAPAAFCSPEYFLQIKKPSPRKRDESQKLPRYHPVFC